MKYTATVVTLEPSHAEIQHAAYQLWMDSGRPEAHDCELWLAAKEMLCHAHVPHANSCRCVLERQTFERTTIAAEPTP